MSLRTVRFRTSLAPFVAVSTLALLAACAAPADEEPGSSADEIRALDAYWADAKKLDLGDLTRLSAGFATDALNDQLTGGRVGARFETPSVFAATARPNRLLPDGAEVKALDTIVSGLAARFGESELGTQVNKARLAHLSGSADDYFVESAFKVNAGLAHGWSFAAPGLGDVGLSVGFDANAELGSRVIVATKDSGLRALVSSPLAAVKQMRGFLYPRSMNDIRAMKPGEMFALRGAGRLGANFGVGAPLLVAEPTNALTYRIVVSAGVSGVVTGQVDVQVVRLPGDEVVVDIGVENGRGVRFDAALRDGWGIKGICDDLKPCLRTVNLAGKKIDLAAAVEKAIEKRVNEYLTFQVEASAGVSSGRVSISRFRFHLDRGNSAETSKALEQLLKFDLRLAQALYNRDLGDAAPAVTADFDAVRAATTSTRNFGFEVLGMNVYHRTVVDRQGTFTVQTPDGARAVLFDYLQKNAGWFQSKHAFTRTGLAAETVDARDPKRFRSEAQLFVQTVSADDYMDDDFVVDSIDAVLLGLAGKDVVATLDRFGNGMQRELWRRCPATETNNGQRGWDEACNVQLLDDPGFVAMKRQGLAAIEPGIARLPEDMKALIRKAAGVRLTLQSVGLHDFDATNGPKTSFTFDMRLDDKALEAMTSRPKEEYASALREMLVSGRAPRQDAVSADGRAYFARIYDGEWGAAMAGMADRFEARAAAYKRIADAEKLLPAALSGKRFVPSPIGLKFTVTADERSIVESAVLRSTSQDRALAATALFDSLYDGAHAFQGASLHPEHIAAFPLLAMVPAVNLEIAMKVDAEVKSTWFAPRKRFQKAGFTSVTATAKGREVTSLGGMFDLQVMAGAN